MINETDMLPKKKRIKKQNPTPRNSIGSTFLKF